LPLLRRVTGAAAIAAAATCGGNPTDPSEPDPVASVVLVGAGDIGWCGSGGAEATARLLDGIEGTVFTAGDNAYPLGRREDFANCYAPTWGRHKGRTRPSPGNHDYNSPDARPYFEYFGENAGPPGAGYYSFDLGAWHIISLNSNRSMSVGSPQEQWLRADAASNPALCTLSYWHHPLFSSGPHGSDSRSVDAWRALYDFGVDVVINGHDHLYERFAPQTPFGAPDSARGIRQFSVGTGGAPLYDFLTARPNSEVRYNGSVGVLKLTLRAHGYDWEFIVAGGRFRDAGTGSCF
jgi:3',5'-cyclic AMP phosphodiesterase CpdA